MAQTLFRKCILAAVTFAFAACCNTESNEVNAQTTNKMYITIDGKTQSVTLANNQATQELVTRLQDGAVTITLNSSGGFEIWGSLGFTLPTSNQRITAQPGDVILYNGSDICLFYGTNSWDYTRLGKIDGLSESELRTFLKAGSSNVAVTLSLTSDATGIRSVRSKDSNAPKPLSPAYTPNGIRTSANHKGIVIQGGKKFIK